MHTKVVLLSMITCVIITLSSVELNLMRSLART
jgi:hypothetical protein